MPKYWKLLGAVLVVAVLLRKGHAQDIKLTGLFGNPRLGECCHRVRSGILCFQRLSCRDEIQPVSASTWTGLSACSGGNQQDSSR